jgi:hypothetical protein
MCEMTTTAWRVAMRPFLAACVLALLLGVGTAVVLDRFVQQPVAVAFATSAARI